MSEATSASTAAGFKWGTSASSLNSTKTATAGSASFSAALTGLTPATTYYYQAYATVRGTEDHASETETFYGDVNLFTTLDYSATVTTGGASYITSSGALIAASYSGANAQPYETCIVYGTSASSLTETAYFNDGGLSAPSGNYSVTLSSLAPATTYYYKAVIQVGTKDFEGSVKSFKTAELPSYSVKGWLELPAVKNVASHFYDSFGEGKSRNYSYCYDTGRYTSLWTAYPLTYSHTQGDGHTSSWRWNPNLEKTKQVNIVSGAYEKNYGNGTYSRGHMCPNADRKSDDGQNGQTFYPTNQLPQIQSGFNSGIWSNLENAVRGLTSSTDTIYVAVGPCYRKVGGSEPVSHLTATSPDIVPQTVDIPNYFYKVLLKVKWSGNTVVSASAIGFWFEHKAYDSSNSNFVSYAVSVDKIEEYTGIDFFTSLPSELQTAAEKNGSWETFRDF